MKRKSAKKRTLLPLPGQSKEEEYLCPPSTKAKDEEQKKQKKGTSHFSPKQKKRRIVIDNNPPLPSLHWDFDEQTTSLLGTIIKESQFFGTYSKHSKWVFNFKFNTHEGNIAIG
jgi:hypothetical protein